MPIRHPFQTTIHAGDFRSGAYCFTVESVLLPQERAGMLTVSASAGYLLTTSLNKDLKREQTFNHSQQSDGSWIAKGDVTLVMTNGSPVDGTVTIRNSELETVTMTINATSTSVEQWLPTLRVSQPALVFAPTSPGKPSFLVLTIAQQHADMPVTLTTDTPEQFQLASDSRPTFLPSLTFTPSANGTYVHVRYFPQKNGVHTGQLLIHTSYEEKTVSLEGRSSRLLPALRSSQLPSASATQRRPAALRRLTLRRSTEQSVTRASRQWLTLLALVFVGGLAYAGYSNRHLLFAALHPDKETKPTTEQVNISPSIPPNIHQTSEKVTLKEAATKRVKMRQEMVPTSALANRATRSPSANPSAKLTTADGITKEPDREAEIQNTTAPTKLNRLNSDNQPNRQSKQRTPPTTPSEESELEHELNKNL